PPPAVAGAWAWTVEQPFSEPVRFTSLVALQAAPDGRVAGLSIDRYGVATLRGSVQADGTLQARKTYAAGPSAPEPGEDATVFLYAGQVQAGDPLRLVDGGWGLVDQPPVADWEGRRAPAFDPATLGGAWTLEADFGVGEAVFIVSDFGQIGGTITDRVGEATVDGVFDPVTGAVVFRKAYRGRDLDWWYAGRLQGARIIDGEYMGEADGLLPDEQPGVWTARRP
ncbi:MAG: hypothetical protein KC613_20600, partial [Myxococcales bacterium]|nr:hypothetical protein [Myxococcales bacterium]